MLNRAERVLDRSRGEPCPPPWVSLGGNAQARLANRTRDAVQAIRQHLAAYRRRGLPAVARIDARAATFLHV